MELLETTPLHVAQWLLQEYLPEVDDTDFTPKQLINYDPRGSFADNLNDMAKDDAIDALTIIIARLLPETYTRPGLFGGNMQYMKPCTYTDDAYEERTAEILWSLDEENKETRGLNGSYDEYIDEHSDADPGL